MLLETRRRRRGTLWAVLGGAALLGSALGSFAAPPAPSFNRDVLPLLSENCFACHGPDSKEGMGRLRLDRRESVLIAAASGKAAIVPGFPQRSELIRRIASSSPAGRMPPAHSHKKPLTTGQVELLKRWIAAGATFDRHWAFVPPVRHPVPAGATHPIDAFVRARLKQEGLTPAPPADPATLLRRVSFDLTGLPPRPDEVSSFVSDRSPDAFERRVDRLLASAHFGERMAMWWLDLARYSDTDGYQSDETRTNWPWRDWVIDSFNANKRFDQFTLEQFAGDMLPGAGPEQRLATCFHRNHMTNGEGGRDPEESRIDYVMDRVATTGSVWLGLTLNCAQCHSHKFDPISHQDYYRLFAFFNSIDEDGKAGKAARPYLTVRSPYSTRALTEAREHLAEVEPVEREARRTALQGFPVWLSARRAATAASVGWQPLRAHSLVGVEGSKLVQSADGSILAAGPNPRQDDYRLSARSPLGVITGIRLDVFPGSNGAFSRGKDGEFLLTDIKFQVRRTGSTQVRDIPIVQAVADYSTDKAKNNNYGDVRDTLDDDPRNGWSTRGAPPAAIHSAVYELANPLRPGKDEELLFEMRHRSTVGDANVARFRVSVIDQPGDAVRGTGPTPIEQLRAAGDADVRTLPAALQRRLEEQFLEGDGAYVSARTRLEAARRQVAEVQKAAEPLEVMVLQERAAARPTHVLVRGVWDKKGERVEPDVPAAVAPWNGTGSKSRLGLAQWLVDPKNPLTSRVIVNHLWQLVFGTGLVRTPEDFGLQGERPTHPELLDWLAVEFVESGWDVKALLRLMVTSQTYRQSSVTPEPLRVRDPDNRLLARSSRFRLPAWMLRDAALSRAGLLNPAIGGPPVRPHQPDGVWEEIFMGRFKYESTPGRAQYRRTLYAFWRRSIAPTFLFDAAQRRVCEVRRPITNTPLQALTLLNDGTQREASHALAVRFAIQSQPVTQTLRELFRAVLGREARDPELKVLEREYSRALTYYRGHPEKAAALLDVESAGMSPPDVLKQVARAALSLTASTLLNLDEALTRE